MQLYLMHHGATLPRELDPKTPLSPVGRESVERAALVMKRRMNVFFDSICTSRELCAQQSAQVVAKVLEFPASHIVADDIFAPQAAPEPALHFLNGMADATETLVVGHMPHLQEVASYLLTGRRGLRLRMEHTSLLCVAADMPLSRPGVLLWHLNAHQLQTLGSGLA